ncbi:MAG: hypothetical protein JSS47_24440 [Proteobacteria bacterium]|nr:hypothetical protein [Pseudomonadota bacterium]
MFAATLLDSAPAQHLIPWRYRQALKRKREETLRERCDREALATRPVDTGQDAPHFEVHMLLGHRHVGMALWAVKSFLKACERRFAVVLHEDGSLTPEDVAALEHHLRGVRIVRKAAADEEMDARLRPYPNCHDYRYANKLHSDHRNAGYNMHIFAVRLFDFNFYSRATKRMFLDADILFFRRPTEILNWIDDPADQRSLYSVETFIPGHDWLGRFVFERRDATFNAGLICLNAPGTYDLELLDEWIGENKHRMDLAPTFEQWAYRHLITREPHLGAPLPDSYPFNYTDATVTATHFGIKVRFFENTHRVRDALQ